MAYKLERLNELIKEVLGRIILEEEEFGQGVLVTIMGAKTSEDGLHCRVAISVFPDKNGPIVLEVLTRHIYHLQQMLNKKLQMRPVPKIRFVLDKTEAEAQEIEEKMGK